MDNKELTPKLSERLREKLRYWHGPVMEKDCESLLSEVESLERSFVLLLFLKNDLVEMKRRYGEAGRDFNRYQWILNKSLAASEEAG